MGGGRGVCDGGRGGVTPLITPPPLPPVPKPPPPPRPPAVGSMIALSAPGPSEKRSRLVMFVRRAEAAAQ